jgi:hypothetical protein
MWRQEGVTMSRRMEFALKTGYVAALALAVLACLALIDRGVEAQVEALGHYAQVWGR